MFDCDYSQPSSHTRPMHMGSTLRYDYFFPSLCLLEVFIQYSNNNIIFLTI